VIPPFSFYLLLARALNRLPMDDDYHAQLAFLLQWKKESGIQHIVEILTYQHNDYRLMFQNAIFGVQYAILGHTDVLTLKVLGDLFVIPLFGVLYLIWRTCGRPRDYTLLAFVPASWTLFQLQYEGTLNFTMGGLQNIPVLLFAVLTCYLAAQSGTGAFWGAFLSLLLCIGSSGNGLFMIPIGAILYLQRREFRMLAGWCGLSAIASLVYFHGYNFATESASHMNNIVGILKHFSPLFFLAFLGNIATIRNPWPAVLFGAILTGVFIMATRDRLFARCPGLYYSALFFFVTAAAVSGLRSTSGLELSLESRYRINSTVLVILLYFYLADKAYGMRVRPLILRAGACIFGVLLVGFNLASDRGGEKVLMLKQHRLEAAMSLWEQHKPRPSMSALSPGNPTADPQASAFYWPDTYGTVLEDAIREGIYKLPELPKGN